MGNRTMGQLDKARLETPRLLHPEYLDIEALLEDLERELVFTTGSLFRSGRLEAMAMPPERRKLALVISGGGAAGAYSAGVLEALLERLRERGIQIDLLVGTSAGALNGFGVFLESLGKANPQLREDPGLRQPYSTFIASIWSYLDRHRASTWVAGRRAWIVGLATKGVNTWLKRWVLAALLVIATFLLNPLLFVSFFGVLGLDQLLPGVALQRAFTSDYALHLSLIGLVSFLLLLLALALVVRTFHKSLLREIPLLRLLANTGPSGDLSRPWFCGTETKPSTAPVCLAVNWSRRGMNAGANCLS